MHTYRTCASSLLTLTLLAGGCASNHTASTTDQSTSAGAVSTAPDNKGAAPTSTKWTAVIDGKQVPCPNIPMGDDATILRILDEGKNRNQVMDHLKYLTGTIGPRLTASSAAFEGNKWCAKLYSQWGLSNVHQEQWEAYPVGFDRGPSSGKLYMKRAARPTRRGADADPSAEPAKVEYDSIRDFQFTTMSWTAGTDGPVRGPVIKQPQTEEEFNAVKDKLKGAWILMSASQPGGQRGFRGALSDGYGLRAKAREKAAAGTDLKELSITERLALEPVAGYISASRNELVLTSGAPGWQKFEFEKLPKDVHVLVTRGDYDTMNSRLADGDEVFAEFDLKNTLFKGPALAFNTIAEIKGSRWPDEVVIVSAHLDSWDGPGAQGAVDNGTGTVVTLEAARILMAAKARPLRTIRFIDWTGEEQGLLGSKAYVKAHAAEMDNISAALVDDGGTNSEGGLTVADKMVEMMAAATAPTNNQFYDETDKCYLNVNIKSGGEKIQTHGASDHASFNAVGVPGFFWDEVGRSDYNHAHHTQFDTYDFAIPRYLEQSSTNAAITAYRLACAPTLLPRAAAVNGSPDRFIRQENPANNQKPTEPPAVKPAAKDGDAKATEMPAAPKP